MQLTFDLPAQAHVLPVTRRVVEGYLRGCEVDIDDDTLDDVILALDEACANVIRHAFGPSETEQCFEVDLTVNEQMVELTVTDDGQGLDRRLFDEVRANGPGDPSHTSGRGLFLIKHLMTSVDLEEMSMGGTKLVMKRQVRPTPALALGADG